MNEDFGLVRNLLNSQEVGSVKFSFIKPQVVTVILNALATLQVTQDIQSIVLVIYLRMYSIAFVGGTVTFLYLPI